MQDLMKGTTKSGFKYSINPLVFRDFEFLEHAEAIQSGDRSMKNIKETLQILLGESGFEKLKEHAKKNNGGYADIEFMMNVITEICENPALKN